MIGHERVLQKVSLISAHRARADALTYVLNKKRSLYLLAAFFARDSASVLAEAVGQTGSSIAILEFVLRAFQLQQLSHRQ